MERLRDLGDDRSWADFHATYARLVRNVALRAGLNGVEVDEVVQETWISVARKMPGFRYEPGRDSFKGWLLHLTRFRIADQFRRRGPGRRGAVSGVEGGSPGNPEEPDGCPPELEALWDLEWTESVSAEALERVRRLVRPEHYEVFHLAVIRQQPLRDVARALGMSLARVYLVKHRMCRAMRDAVRAVRLEWD